VSDPRDASSIPATLASSSSSSFSTSATEDLGSESSRNHLSLVTEGSGPKAKALKMVVGVSSQRLRKRIKIALTNHHSQSFQGNCGSV